MKKITAVIRVEAYEPVSKALERCGYPGIMVSDIEGHGKQKGVVQVWRGEKFRMELLPKLKMEIVVADQHVDRIINEICKAASTGQPGDGKIFVSPIDEAVRIRTGERGEKAL